MVLVEGYDVSVLLYNHKETIRFSFWILAVFVCGNRIYVCLLLALVFSVLFYVCTVVFYNIFIILFIALPKAHTVFTLQYDTLIIELYGNHLCYRTAERTVRKFKSKATIQL